MIVNIYFNESPNGEIGLLGERTRLVLANNTGIDIHIQVTGDVHTGNWGPKEINHTEEPQVESKRVPVGTSATYTISVWKNNSGKPGKYLGTFDHPVVVYDRLEFIIAERHGKTHMIAVSWRLAAEIIIGAIS